MDKLNLLWTTDNRDTFFNMLSMYAINALKKGWWENVNVIIWGASAKLAGHDEQVQAEILEMINEGVTIEACKDCCDRFNVTEVLVKLGVSVKYMGKPFTEYIKNEEKIITI